MFLRSLVLMTTVAVLPATYAVACSTEANANMHHHGGMMKAKKTGLSASSREYEAAMLAMHKDMNAPLSGDVDVDFVRQMLPHHQGAVAMAKTQLKYGKDEALKRLSRWIIFTQEQEIGFMKTWLYRRDDGGSPKGAKDYFGASMATMHHGMMIDYTGDADLDFVRGMIPHHQGAVDMARILLADGADPELNKLANGIFSSQSYEIDLMQRWLEKHAAKKSS